MQGHRHHGVAVSHRLQNHWLCTSLREHNTIPSIRQLAGTDGSFISDIVDWIDIQRHSHHRVAVIHRLQGCDLCTRLREDNIVPSVGQLTGTDGSFISDVVNRIDVQRHGYHGVAVIHRLQGCDLCTSGGEFHTIPSIRQLTGTDGSFISDVMDRIDIQRHGYHGVAVIHRLQSCDLHTRLREDNIVPSIRQLAGTDGSFIGHVVCRINIQCHCHY